VVVDSAAGVEVVEEEEQEEAGDYESQGIFRPVAA
jgi:hypothetical protein